MVSYPDHSHRGVAQPWTISVGNVSFHDEFGADVPSLPLRKHNGLYYYYTPPLMHSPSTLYAPLPFKPRMSPPASIHLMKRFPFPSMRCLWCLMMTCHHMGMGQPGHNFNVLHHRGTFATSIPCCACPDIDHDFDPKSK